MKKVYTDLEIRKVKPTNKRQVLSVGDGVFIVVEPIKNAINNFVGKSLIGKCRFPPSRQGKQIDIRLGLYGRGEGYITINEAKEKFTKLKLSSQKKGLDPREILKKEGNKNIDIELLNKTYYMLKKIRMVEERIAKEYPNNEIRCPTHLSIGQEGVPAVLSTLIKKSDFFVSTHRGHAHYLSKGGDLNKMIAELYGKKTGCSGGKGGSMHLIDKDNGFMGTSAIVGNSIPLGVGLGLSIKLKRNNNISCIFIGDGAIEEGVFYESLNFAVLKSLPVLFICENNLYSVYSPLEVRQPKNRQIFSLAKAIGAKVSHGDGNDVFQSRKILKNIISEVRTGKSSTWFVEFDTYRWREHCGYQYDNHIGYRDEKEFLSWKERDPIELFKKNTSKIVDFNSIDRTIEIEIEEAFNKAKKDPFPEPEEAFENIYSDNIEI